MKKLLLAGASTLALFTAAPAFAQSNSSAVDQSGHGQQAIVGQTGSNGSSTVTQRGFDNGAAVTQAGTSNTIAIDQTGADVPPSAPAIPGTTRFDTTKSNIAEATQHNEVEDSEIDIKQTGNNLAQSVQRGYGAGGSASQSALIVQAGNGNRVMTDQRGGNLSVVANQSGDNNNAFMNQDHVVLNSASTINQTGDGNYAELDPERRRRRVDDRPDGRPQQGRTAPSRATINPTSTRPATSTRRPSARVAGRATSRSSRRPETAMRRAMPAARPFPRPSSASCRAAATMTRSSSRTPAAATPSCRRPATATCRTSTRPAPATPKVTQNGNDNASSIIQSGNDAKSTVLQTGANSISNINADFGRRRHREPERRDRIDLHRDDRGRLNLTPPANTVDVTQTRHRRRHRGYRPGQRLRRDPGQRQPGQLGDGHPDAQLAAGAGQNYVEHPSGPQRVERRRHRSTRRAATTSRTTPRRRLDRQ